MEETKTTFQLGLISYNVARDWNLEALIKNAKTAGYAGLEFRTTHAHGVEVTLSPERRKEVAKQVTDAGLLPWGFGTVCEFHSADKSIVRGHIESCKQWCQLAHDMGVKGVKVRPNGFSEGVTQESTFEQVGKALQECGKAAADNGVEIWVEVHGKGTAHPPHIKTMLDLCGHPKVGICWNSNPEDVKDGSVKPYFDLLQPYLRSVHINDLWNTKYPYRELFSLLRKSGYKGLTLCEVGTPVPSEAGVVFLNCYRGLWQALQE